MFKRKRKNDERRSRRIVLLLLNILALLMLAGLVIYRANSMATAESARQADTAAQTSGATRLSCTDLDALVNALESGGEWIFDCKAMVYLPEVIVITRDTTLIGNSDFLTMFSGRNIMEAMIWVENGAALTLKNVHITEATRYGIYVVSGSTLIADNCRFSDIGGNIGDGAALWNDGTAHISRCTFEKNYGATDISGAIFSSPEAMMTIKDSQIVRNKVGIYSQGPLSLESTTIGHNGLDCLGRSATSDPGNVCARNNTRR